MKNEYTSVSQELLWLFISISLSFSIWGFLTLLADQTPIVDSYRYNRELLGFVLTIGFIYLLRLSSRWVNLA